MLDLLQLWSPYFLYISVLCLLLALVAGVGVVLIVSLSIKRAAKKKALAPAIPMPVKEKSLKSLLSWIDLFSGLLTKVLIHWGLLSKDELSRAFITAKKLLKRYIGGPNYMYQIPWYLMVGPEKAGKTTLLSQVPLELPIGRPDFEVDESNPLVGWWFFDRGIVLDIRGDQVLKSDAPQSQESSWRYLLSLISVHRPKRPLDGLILVLPVHELLPSQALTEDAIFDRGRHISRKLWQMQSELSMRLPIYVVITQCDRLAGFDQTVWEMPPHRLNEIWGWSTPYALETAFSPSWSDKIFQHMGETLRHIRSLLLAEGKEKRNRDGTFLLAQAFQSMRGLLSCYLNTIFKDSAYHESFFLRGVYFVGDGARPSPEELNGIAQDPPREHEEEPGEYLPPHPQLAFLKELFLEKIFKEAELAQPVMRVLLSTNRLLNFSKVCVCVVSLLWVGGLFMARENLQDTQRHVAPLLNQIDRAVSGSQELNVAGKEAQLALYLKDQSNAILDLMKDVQRIDLFSLAIPASWVTPLGHRLIEALTFAYDTIVLRDLWTALQKKGDTLTDPSKTDQFIRSGKYISFDPTELISFNTLKDYVDSLTNFEKKVFLYNDLESSRSMDSIAQLVLYLYGRELPAPFYESSPYFRSALASAKDRPLKVALYREFAREKLKLLFSKFLLDAFNVRETLQPLIDLQELLTVLGDPSGTKMNDDDLRGLLEKMQAVKKVAQTETFKWIENKDFFPGDAYGDILTKIGSSEILGTAIANELTNQANTQFQGFKDALVVFKSDLSGPFFRKINGQVVSQTSERFNLITKTLETFLSQRFMQFVKKYRDLQPIPPQQMMFWDDVMLQSATSLIDDFRKYEAEGLTEAPVELQNALRNTAQKTLRKKLIHYVAKSQSFREEPTGIRTAAIRDILASQVQNLKVSTPLFTRILGMFEGVGFDQNATTLKEALVGHAFTLLRKIERLVRDENLYEVRESNFRSWLGGKNVAFTVFGVSDAEGLTAYLAAQRERTVFYAKDLAQPIVDFLNLSFFEKSPDTLPLILKWDGLQRQIDHYEKKTPGNDIATLEDFVSNQMNDLTINDCDAVDPVKGGSFFNTRLRKIQLLLRQKCDNIAQRRFFMRYNKIAQFFNVQLAGRYPFKQGVASEGGSEASPRMIRTFYKVYALFTPYDLKRLEAEAKDSVPKAEAYDFLKSMSGLKPLLIHDQETDQGVTKDPPQFKVEFRTNREQEVGANQITQMTLTLGSKTINWRDPDKSGSFIPGVPLKISFKWASNGQNVPKEDPSQPDLSVTGTEATFNYSGNWGILKLLTNHAQGQPVGTGATKIWRLKFTIPLTNVVQNQTVAGGGATVFVDFELTEKGSGHTAQLVNVSNTIPTEAKILDISLLTRAEKNAEEEIRQAAQEDNEEKARESL